jgi:hypothetical protein
VKIVSACCNTFGSDTSGTASFANDIPRLLVLSQPDKLDRVNWGCRGVEILKADAYNKDT